MFHEIIVEYAEKIGRKQVKPIFFSDFVRITDFKIFVVVHAIVDSIRQR